MRICVSKILRGKRENILSLAVMRMPTNLPQPTRQLGEPGLDLWVAVQSEYMIEDAGGVAVLMACAALDLAESLAARVRADGVTVHGPHRPEGAPVHRRRKSEPGVGLPVSGAPGRSFRRNPPYGPGPGRKPKGWEGFDADE